MEMKVCPNGHFYDGDIYTSCPECASRGMQNGNPGGIGVTEPVGQGAGFGNVGATEPVGGAGFNNMNYYNDSRAGGDFFNDQETVAAGMSNSAGFAPVVGWLVCVDGPDRGNDYRIRVGYNHIGRGENMDICIHGDQNISREKHAMVAYDDQEKRFFFGPSEGRNIVRVNGKMVMVPTELKSRDIVTVGSTKLMFVPLCGEDFDWDL